MSRRDGMLMNMRLLEHRVFRDREGGVAYRHDLYHLARADAPE